MKNTLIPLTQLPSIVSLRRLVPESTRWLAVRGRRDEAEKILRHAAKINNRKCPDQILVLEDKDTSVGRVSLLALRSSPLLMVRCIVICLNWWVVFLIFGSTQNLKPMSHQSCGLKAILLCPWKYRTPRYPSLPQHRNNAAATSLVAVGSPRKPSAARTLSRYKIRAVALCSDKLAVETKCNCCSSATRYPAAPLEIRWRAQVTQIFAVN